jgi:hypothetical protein
MNAIYSYIDWFIYLNLVFSQLDIVLIEFAGEMFITFIVTRMYLSISPKVSDPSTDVSNINMVES